MTPSLRSLLLRGRVSLPLQVMVAPSVSRAVPATAGQPGFPPGSYVTAVGGTELTTSGPGGTWKSETAWPLSGGGVTSDGFAIPTYQLPLINSVNQGSTTLRNVPDVAAHAAGMYDCARGSAMGAWNKSVITPLGWFSRSVQSAGERSPYRILNPAIYTIPRGRL